jgi:hypothetical protein
MANLTSRACIKAAAQLALHLTRLLRTQIQGRTRIEALEVA